MHPNGHCRNNSFEQRGAEFRLRVHRFFGQTFLTILEKDEIVETQLPPVSDTIQQRAKSFDRFNAITASR